MLFQINSAGRLLPASLTAVPRPASAESEP